MNQDTSWEANHRYIRWFAAKALQRAMAAGIRGVQLEDLVQEASIAWMTARDRYDPSRGVPFIAYLQRGLQLHINRWLKYEIEECQRSNFSLDLTPEGDDGSSMAGGHNLFPSADLPQDERLMRNESWRRVVSQLSPLARRYVELLENPPPEVYVELKAVMAKAELGRSMGIARLAPVRVSSDFIFRLMGLSTYERAKITREIQGAVERART